MNAWLLLVTTVLIVCFRAFAFRRLWNEPLVHGPGFFLRIEVPPGFYEGDGARWLRRYRGVLVAEHAVEAAVLAGILLSGRWEVIPAWAGGAAVLMTATLLGFGAFAHRKLAPRRRAPRAVAIALEPRRLTRYISWRVETAMFAILAASWLALLLHPAAWQAPAAFTWAVVALVPMKVLVVRAGGPLPADRTVEHHRWNEANRRHSLRVLDSMRWLLLAIFAGYALLHGWPGGQPGAWVRWCAVAVALGVSCYMMALILRGGGRLAAMGHDLRPVATGAGMARAGWIWMAVYLGGLAVVLLAIPG